MANPLTNAAHSPEKNAGHRKISEERGNGHIVRGASLLHAQNKNPTPDRCHFDNRKLPLYHPPPFFFQLSILSASLFFSVFYNLEHNLLIIYIYLLRVHINAYAWSEKLCVLAKARPHLKRIHMHLHRHHLNYKPCKHAFLSQWEGAFSSPSLRFYEGICHLFVHPRRDWEFSKMDVSLSCKEIVQ